MGRHLRHSYRNSSHVAHMRVVGEDLHLLDVWYRVVLGQLVRPAFVGLSAGRGLALPDVYHECGRERCDPFWLRPSSKYSEQRGCG